MHPRFQSLLGCVYEQLVCLPAPGYESGASHPDPGLPRESCHRLSVCSPVRARPVDELVRHRADFERMANGFDPAGQDLAQLPVGQVRSGIDIIEVEDKERHIVHSTKLPSVLAAINLCRVRASGAARGVT